MRTRIDKLKENKIMSEFYTMKIAGLERNLEKFPVSDSLDIAATDMVAGQFKGGSAFIVEVGVCKLPDRTAFAGSIAEITEPMVPPPRISEWFENF